MIQAGDRFELCKSIEWPSGLPDFDVLRWGLRPLLMGTEAYNPFKS